MRLSITSKVIIILNYIVVLLCKINNLLSRRKATIE